MANPNTMAHLAEIWVTDPKNNSKDRTNFTRGRMAQFPVIRRFVQNFDARPARSKVPLICFSL